jgi:hypothetical protein
MSPSPRQLMYRDPEVQPGPSSATTVPADRSLLTRRSLRLALGILWLLDGVLQLQPYMFTKGFALKIITPVAAGQPFFVAAPVRWNAALIGTHPALFNGVFAGVQLALGIGLLLSRTSRAALVASVFWAGGVWYVGEGLGGLVGGHVSALAGAPGAALLYGILALAAWPGRQLPWPDAPKSPRRPPRWILRVWASLWIGFAALNLLPGNGSSAIQSDLSSSASTVSPWLGNLDHWMADVVHGAGAGAGALLVAAQLSIGLLSLGRGRLQRAALWSGLVLALLYWAGGQSFGQLFSGQATDPSTGPLLALVGLAGLGAAADARSPLRGMRRTTGNAVHRRVALG